MKPEETEFGKKLEADPKLKRELQEFKNTLQASAAKRIEANEMAQQLTALDLLQPLNATVFNSL